MKLDATMKVKVIGKGTEESKDGKTTYYRLLIMQGMEAGKLGCPEGVYNDVKEGDERTFKVQYNDEYKSFRIVDVLPDILGTTKQPADATKQPTPTGTSK